MAQIFSPTTRCLLRLAFIWRNCNFLLTTNNCCRQHWCGRVPAAAVGCWGFWRQQCWCRRKLGCGRCWRRGGWRRGRWSLILLWWFPTASNSSSFEMFLLQPRETFNDAGKCAASAFAVIVTAGSRHHEANWHDKLAAKLFEELKTEYHCCILIHF